MVPRVPFWGKHRNHNNEYVMLQTFVCFLLWCLIHVDWVDALEKREFDSFHIEVHTVRPSSVDLTWSSSSDKVAIHRLAVCDIIIWSAKDQRRHALENYSLQNHMITIKFLEQKTHYALFFSCHVQVPGISFRSKTVNFETGSRGSVPSSTKSPTVLSWPTGVQNVSHIHGREKLNKKNVNYSMNHSHSQPEDGPTIYEHKPSALPNSLDSILGIVLAVIGGILVTLMSCYVWKSCRRHQRQQQLLRHEYDSDQFAIIQQNIHET